MNMTIPGGDRIMRKQNGITRIDVVVALACVVFIFANVQVFSAVGQGRAKLEVCMANLRALSSAWSMYTNDHNDHLPCGDVYYSEDPQILQYSARECQGPSWFRWPHVWPGSPTAPGPDNPLQTLPGAWNTWPESDWKHAIWHGSLWPYIGDYGIYKCPVGEKNAYVTYTIVHSMNAYPGVFAPADWEIYYQYQIKSPDKRIVFIDNGYPWAGSFGIVNYPPNVFPPPAIMQDPATRGFYDLPPMRHNYGTTFSFADGHAGYRKWVDPRTLNYHWGDYTSQWCNQDMYWLQKAVWGRLGFTPPTSCPPEF